MAASPTPKLSRKGWRKQTGAGDMGMVAYHSALSDAVNRKPGGPNAPPASTVAQIGQAIQAAPSGLLHFAEGATTDPIAGAGTGALLGGSIGSVVPGAGTVSGALIGGAIGGAVGTVGALGKWAFGDDDDPFEMTREVGSSIQRTAGRIANPSRYARASERGEIVGAIVEDLANLSIVAGGAKIGIAGVGGKGLAAAAQLDRGVTSALRTQAIHLAEAERLTSKAVLPGVAEAHAEAILSRAAEHMTTSQAFGAQAQALGGAPAAAAARARPMMRAYRAAESVERLGAQGAFLPAKVWLLPGKVVPKAAQYFGPGLGAQIERTAWGESLMAAAHAATTSVKSWKSSLQDRVRVRDEAAVGAQGRDAIMGPIEQAAEEIYRELPKELHQEAAIIDHQRLPVVLAAVAEANPELVEAIIEGLTREETGAFSFFSPEGLRMALDVEMRQRLVDNGQPIPAELEARMPAELHASIRKGQEIYRTRIEAPLAVHHTQGTGRFERPFTEEAQAKAQWDVDADGPLPSAMARMGQRWDRIEARMQELIDDANERLNKVAEGERWTPEEINAARKTIRDDLTEATRLATDLVVNQPTVATQLLEKTRRVPKTKSDQILVIADMIYKAPSKGVTPGDGSVLGDVVANGIWADGHMPSGFKADLTTAIASVRAGARLGQVEALQRTAADLRTRAEHARNRGDTADANLADAIAAGIDESLEKMQAANERLDRATEAHASAVARTEQLNERAAGRARAAAQDVLRDEVRAYRETIADETAKVKEAQDSQRSQPPAQDAPAPVGDAPPPGGITPESMNARAAELKQYTETGPDYERGVVENLQDYRRYMGSDDFGQAEYHLLKAEYLADKITWDQMNETLAARQKAINDFMDPFGDRSYAAIKQHRADRAALEAKRHSGELSPAVADSAIAELDRQHRVRDTADRNMRRELEDRAEQARYEPIVEGAKLPPSVTPDPPVQHAPPQAAPLGDPLFMDGTVAEAVANIEAARGIIHHDNMLDTAAMDRVNNAVADSLLAKENAGSLLPIPTDFTPVMRAAYKEALAGLRLEGVAGRTKVAIEQQVRVITERFTKLGVRSGRAQGAASALDRAANVTDAAATRTEPGVTSQFGPSVAESVASPAASGLREGYAAGQRHRDVVIASQQVANLERHAARLPARRAAALAREAALIRNAPARYRPALVMAKEARGTMGKVAAEADIAVPGSGDVIRAALDEVPETLALLVDGLGDTPRPAFYRGGELPRYGTRNAGRSSEGMLPRTARATNEYFREGVTGPTNYREVTELNGQMVAQWMANEVAHAVQARFGASASSVLVTPDEGALFRTVRAVLGDTDRFLVQAGGDAAQARLAMVTELRDAGYVLIEMERTRAGGDRVGAEVAVHFSLTTRGRVDPIKLSDAMAERGYVPYTPEQLFLTTTPTQVKVDTVFLPEPMFRAMRQQIGPAGKYEQLARKVYDPVQGVWKGSVLAYSPRWQVGNAVGNSIMTTVSTLMGPVSLFRGMNRGRKIIKAMHDGTVDQLPPDLQALAAQIESRLHQGSDSPAMRGSRAGEYETPRGSPLWRTRSGKQAGLIRRGANKMYALNGLVDDMNRIAVFERSKKTLTLAQVAEHAGKDLSLAGRTYDQIHTEVAVRMSLKVAGDFNKLLPFERQVIKRIIPFYPWIRHITQLSYRLPKSHPMRVAWILHLADIFGEPPEFSFLEGAIPMDDEGWFFRLGGNLNPFADSAFGVDPSQLSGWRDIPAAVGGSFSPAIQVPVQIATGLDMRTMQQTRRPAGTSQLDMYGREKASPFGIGEGLLRIADTMPQPRIGRALADEIFNNGQILRYGTGEPIRSSGGNIPKVGSNQKVPAGLMPILDVLGIPYPVKHDLDELRGRRDERYRRDAAAEDRYYGRSSGGAAPTPSGGPKLSRKGWRKQTKKGQK